MTNRRKYYCWLYNIQVLRCGSLVQTHTHIHACTCTWAMYASLVCGYMCSYATMYRENLAYGIRILFTQCTFQYLRSKNVSLVFVVFVSKNLSANLRCRLRRLIVSSKGEISLQFDLPSLYSYHTLIRIPAPGLSRFIQLLYVPSPFKLLRYRRTISRCYQWWNSTLARSLRSFRTAPPRSI